MEAKTQKGTLVLADISGYTFFLANTELEHANIALSYLLETIVEQMSAGLTISKLEGDAVFAFVEEGKPCDGQALLDLIDRTYAAFRERAGGLYQGATCPCKACRAIPTLDLKFVVHCGDFIIQQIAGIKDLLGSDVNLVHRLLKNSVADSTGWRGYALFTRQGVERLPVEKSVFLPQSETYEHFGTVDTYVMDLHPRYQNRMAE